MVHDDTTTDDGQDTTDEVQGPDVEAPEEDVATQADPRDTTIAALRDQLAEAQARLRAVSKAFTEQKEEMAKFRDRVEAQAKVREARKEFQAVQAFFEPVQNLKRSIEAGTADLDGIKMVHQQFQRSLDKLGLEPIPGIGAPFDPNMHEALALMPVTDEAQDGRVLMVHVDGYMVHGKPLQPAQVVVGQYTAPAPADDEAASEDAEDSGEA